MAKKRPIKRKFIEFKIEDAPDGYFGFGVTNNNVPNVTVGDEYETVIDKIISVIDKLSPALPPSLEQLTLTVSESPSIDGPVTGRFVDGSGNASNIYRFSNGAILTYTTTGNPSGIAGSPDRVGHFRGGDSNTAKLRFRHINNVTTITADINDGGTVLLADFDIDDGTFPFSILNVSGNYDIAINILEKKDFYSDDPTLSAQSSNFFTSIQASASVEMVSSFNEADGNLRQVFLEYSDNGLYTDTITPSGVYQYRIDGAATPTATSVTVTPQAMGGFVSGVPTLEIGDTITVAGTINNGIKFYKPSIIGSSTATGTSSQSDNIASDNDTANTSHAYSEVHTVNSNQYFESVAASITPFDVFGSGTVGNATTDTTTRIDTRSLSKASTDASIRRLSPTTGSDYAAFSGSSYSVGSHANTLNPGVADVYTHQLQLINNVYRYPINTNYVAFGGPNYSGLSNERYADFRIGTITNRTNINLLINGSTGISAIFGNANFKLFLQIEGVTGWLDCDAAFVSGTPLIDGDPAVDVGSSISATNRRITFGANRSGNLNVRIGLTSASVVTFSTITFT